MAGTISNWWSNLFSWGNSKSDNDDNEKSRIALTSKAKTDFTDKFAVNYALTNGIYNNTYQGMKLAGFGFNIINVPVSFMGLPIVEYEDNEEIKEQLQQIILDKSSDCRSIHTQSHRDGTFWIYPTYQAEKGLVWKKIPDQIITKIVRDLNADDIVQVTTEEEITLNSSTSDNIITVVKKVVYTAQDVVTTYEGDSLPAGVSNSRAINPAGIVPVNFANNSDVNMSRGHSDYERILSDLKSYHDIFLALVAALAKFNTKMVQTTKDSDKWLANNGETPESMADYSIGNVDFIMNQVEEKTEFIHPDNNVQGYITALKLLFHKLVELSGIPEIAWGLKTEGNLASVEENMAILMQYCRDKQNQKIKPYTILIQASARLLTAASVLPEIGEIKITWNVLDSTSQKTKAEVMKMFAEAINKLGTTALMTPQQLYNFWSDNFAGITEDDFDTWWANIQDMVTHVVSTRATPTERLLAQGVGDE